MAPLLLLVGVLYAAMPWRLAGALLAVAAGPLLGDTA
jgi:hypothetical protein